MRGYLSGDRLDTGNGKQRQELLQSRLLGVYGTWQTGGEVRNLIADTLFNLTPFLEGWERRVETSSDRAARVPN